MNREMDRREWLIAALGSPIVAQATSAGLRNVRAFRLIEQSGLRRFSYPVQTIVPDAVEGRNFRLLRDGRAIPAQFRVVETSPGRRELILDFSASPEPLETQNYEVLFGPKIEPGPEPRGGLNVEERDGRLLVSQGGTLAYEFSERAGGFLDRVGSPRLGYLREGSGGLSIVEKDPKKDGSKTEARTRVTREGPFAVGIRSEWSGPSGQASRLDLTIPHTKSWVEAIWTVADSDRRVQALTLDLNLRIEGSPTLVDFGAGSTIYGQIQGRQRMELVANREDGWQVRQGEGEEPAVLAASTAASPRAAEGWAHIMDARRCTALAVANFGKSGHRDRIAIEADGRLRFRRDFPATAAGPKSLAFWLHFVPMPVQVGAATSPQSILSPLEVAWDRGNDR